MTRSTLTLAVNAVKRITDMHAEALEFDAGFDGGEFSGPAHARAESREIQQALADLGWTVEEYDDELEARTTPKWAFQSALSAGWYIDELI